MEIRGGEEADAEEDEEMNCETEHVCSSTAGQFEFRFVGVTDGRDSKKVVL